MTAPRYLMVGGTCRRGHAITSPDDVVIHGRDLRLRCKACVREAHANWKARGYQAIGQPARPIRRQWR